LVYRWKQDEVADLSNIEGIDADYLNSRVLLTKLIDNKIIIESYLETGDIGYAPDGSTYMGEYQMNELAFIKKDDYWQGNFEMEKIEDIFHKT
jgi:hypothetical protein